MRARGSKTGAPRSKNPKRLAFGELEPLASALLSVLLALMLAGITGEEAGLFEFRPEFSIEFDQRAGDTEPDGICLTGNSTAVGENQNIKLVGHFGDEKCLANRNTPGF